MAVSGCINVDDLKLITLYEGRPLLWGTRLSAYYSATEKKVAIAALNMRAAEHNERYGMRHAYLSTVNLFPNACYMHILPCLCKN
jgi:hypothetical protein